MSVKHHYDIVVIGASIGGVLAAYSAAKSGKKVVLTEETDWIGGQLTSQAVPPDEHKWIEEFGCTSTYRSYRNKVRDYYRSHPFISNDLKDKDLFCPGGSSVSRLSHEPKVALHFLNELLLPFINNGSLTLLLNHKAVSSKKDNEVISEVTIENLNTKRQLTLTGLYFLDGTDVGDLLPITDTDYVTGAESKDETNELHANETRDPYDMQPVTWVAAVDYVEGENHVIEKPIEYEFYKKLMQPYDQYPILSWYGPDSSTGKAKQFGMFPKEKGENGENLFSLWTYRRIVAPHHYTENFQPNDITLINWPQNDYFLGNLFEDDNIEHHRHMAKQLTLSFVYWLQTEAPRKDGGVGYPGIRLRGDVLGTEDGLAKYPYIRESRRIKSLFTVNENHINANVVKQLPTFYDTVGVGCYHIDLHITTKTNKFFYDHSWPFEIPLGSMIPVKTKNLIPACKNIGTTHLTNGCFRLHPVEWNIGEVAGYLASYAIDNNLSLIQIRNNHNHLEAFQALLVENGIELHWPKDQVTPI
ncbi:FAD-dependent oxidoreductase [Haloplasma contractile]|uniref:Dihydrolipoamide dehydrogenase protein n=1 Tax=Haloplasma contractile SSD-17B TaxID=1033810 RepID=U2EGB2_9MOLU|nr:FAD-dependent oxidoreductase [Haloplasma contractile]ERJ13656.1 dihydrolipoamide dehydrogenase protein [Haloplasma contractile SSD-17B]